VTSLESHLLIATPDLAEPFRKAVVLIVRHNEDGALGLILNRRTEATLQDTWTRLSKIPCHRVAELFLGGPCEGPLVALHTHEFLMDNEVLPGLYFSASKDKLETLVAQDDTTPPDAKFFAGYSGWSPGQLENELAEGSWSVMPAKLEHVFWHEEELWTRAVRFVSDAAWRSALQVKHVPPDLRLN